MWPLRPNSSRSVRDSMMTSATSPANWMSFAPMVSSTRSRRAVGAMLARDRERFGQRRDLRARGARAGGVGARARAFGDALRAEKAGCDGRARAGQRNEGDGDARVLDREAERGAHLVAVKRAMARARVPARALARPGVGMRVRSVGHAGAVAVVAGAARPVELAGLDAEEAAEAEAFVGEAHRPVGIAFAGGDRSRRGRRSARRAPGSR